MALRRACVREATAGTGAKLVKMGGMNAGSESVRSESGALQASRGSGGGSNGGNARGWALLHDPLHNRDTAFKTNSRAHFGLRGLVPPAVENLEQQVSTAACAVAGQLGAAWCGLAQRRARRTRFQQSSIADRWLAGSTMLPPLLLPPPRRPPLAPLHRSTA